MIISWAVRARGSSSGTGGTASGSGAASTAGGGAGGRPTLPSTLQERIQVSDVTVPAGVKDGVMNWRVWGREDLNVSWENTNQAAALRDAAGL